MERNTVKGRSHIKLEIYTMKTGKVIWRMIQESTFLQMAMNTLEIIKRGRDMADGNSTTQIRILMRVNVKTICTMVKESIRMLTKNFMKDFRWKAGK